MKHTPKWWLYAALVMSISCLAGSFRSASPSLQSPQVAVVESSEEFCADRQSDETRSVEIAMME
ncbi:hypothetical protein [Pontibacter sp. G13]|uniref:hypothetical protein n=1 Tax=Pontibacter sp. G13 TaxID=3074898 RepID=UPI002889102E|nr:hypothetical protein [Pontibacter sp. G13]WNJ20234.1 hypothetical protein RJD25_07120 [Pontibacter sp. G13]